ncbi:LysM peptidoglycan-binding domain-containing protein [bacterium]|jgi:hypothetical protein|nr:LysM peptidoglycan-binding domain-containing protein [bacterium]MBT4251317.1 LysM peptidoglycan-binding domain-containing protein [bacterium]MBT4598302.1 LysM peptidoglycan-binding domain-containing protein [bacterium]MBT6754135.1 LysM peptidoglycan-binding domain-containing protein [bacterium]MBT7037955.1 LysM peptidoglycan-binding domain-containing protein [bacterium]
MFKDYNRPNYSKSDQPKENRRREVPGEKKMGRRTFLKATALIGASLGIGKFAMNLFDDKEVEDDNEQERLEKGEPREELATEGQLEIERDDENIIGSTIEEQLKKSEKVTLNIETKNALRKKWKESYAKKPVDCPAEDKETGRNHLGLLQSMERMQPWIADIKAEFRKIGVPEKFAYLAIPESHFDVNGNSRAMAKGPYQFTKETAKLFELSVGNGIDERCDPIQSARACAEHLKYSYGRFNDDWELAFADYNGGFTNDYAKFRPKKADRNYEDYLAWREGRINNYIAKDHYQHKVKKSDQNLTKISRFYGISVADIMEANEMKDDQINIGQELKIPATTSVKMFKLRDSLENLNYPEKFYAVLDVIEEEELEKQFPSSPVQFNVEEVPRIKTTDFSYKVKKGDGLFAIARRIKSAAEKKSSKMNLSILQVQRFIQEQNKISNPGKIYQGQELKVKLPLEGGVSLNKIAHDRRMLIKDLEYLNPAIVDSKEILSIGRIIRTPK